MKATIPDAVHALAKISREMWYDRQNENWISVEDSDRSYGVLCIGDRRISVTRCRESGEIEACPDDPSPDDGDILLTSGGHLIDMTAGYIMYALGKRIRQARSDLEADGEDV